MSEFELPRVEKELFNVDNENLQKLASLFPSAVKDGQLDIEALKEELGQFEEVGQEKYELNWAGKQNAKKEARKNPVGKTLRYIKGDGVDEDTTQNLYIEGDNLEVLKLLRKNYYGSIKMIYIDPPYNTGNDFVYNDNFSISQEELEQMQGERDEYGEKLQKNPKDSAKYHTNWLNMMYPRLQLAKDLLTNDGVIFMSVDDNEITNLRKLCNEIFGENNFLAQIVWQKKTSPDARMDISAAHDFIVAYTKNFDREHYIFNSLPYDEERLKSYKNPDNDPRGEWASVDITGQTGRAPKSQFYEITTPSGKKYFPPEGRCWAMAEYTFNELYKDNRLWFGENGNNRPRLKKFLSESDGMRPWTWWDNKFAGHNQDGNKELMNLFGGTLVFDNPKPTKLIKRLISLVTNKDNNDIILDFFGGSSTTAHSILELNNEDDGNRVFIIVQILEIISEDGNGYKSNSGALKLGYKNICEIGKERIRRAGQNIKEEIEQGNKQLKLGEEPKQVGDIGFKVFRVGETTLNWEKMALKGEDILHDYAPDTSNKDKLDFTPTFENDFNVVYEIMLRQEGLPLTSRIETLTDIGNRTYLVANTYLISLEENITPEIVEKLSLLNPIPMKFIFRDSAFEDNIDFKDETFRRLNALIDKNSYEDKKTYTVKFI